MYKNAIYKVPLHFHVFFFAFYIGCFLQTFFLGSFPVIVADEARTEIEKALPEDSVFRGTFLFRFLPRDIFISTDIAGNVYTKIHKIVKI